MENIKSKKSLIPIIIGIIIFVSLSIRYYYSKQKRYPFKIDKEMLEKDTIKTERDTTLPKIW